tara:strand:- start:7511 stop:7738 length:228 start_codon:yes stop_codon:yes gene_type:complete
MSHIVIDTNTFSFKNITNIVNNNFHNDAFNILCDIVASHQIRGMHYTHTNNLGEAQKAAYIDGYDIRNDFFMSEN